MPAEKRRITPGQSTLARAAFENRLSAIINQATTGLLIYTETLVYDHIRRNDALTASRTFDPTPLTALALEQAWSTAIETALGNGFERLAATVPEELRATLWELYSTFESFPFIDGTIPEYVYRRVLETFTYAREQGLSPSQTERAMGMALSLMTPEGEMTGIQTRALRMARTASTSVYNRAMLEQIRGDGYTLKLWVSHHDERVRDSHLHVDGVAIGLDQPFRVGGALLSYPGDPTAPIGQTINCRCVLVGEMGEPTVGIDWDQPVIPLSDRIAQGFEPGPFIDEPALVLASGGPDQARAPKGTPIGGRWIVTPGGLLKRVHLDDQGTLPLGYPGDEGGADYPVTATEAYFLPNRSDSSEDFAYPVQRYLFDNPGQRPYIAEEIRTYMSEQASQGVTVSMFPKGLRGVVEDGRMRNAHEVDARDPMYMVGREDYELNTMGVVEPNEVWGTNPQHRPIYGHAGRWRAEDAWASGYYYGPIEVHLKPEVLDRTTWTIGDSLDTAQRPTWTREIADGDDRTIFHAAERVLASHGNHTDEDGSLNDPIDWDAVPYLEAQVHGGVTLDDIDAVRLQSLEESLLPTVKALAERGITVYVAERDVTEKVLLASGNPTQARAPKGTSIGGQWIDTPNGLLHEATGELVTREEFLPNRQEVIDAFSEHPRLRELSENPTNAKMVGTYQRMLLRSAAKKGVTVTVDSEALDGIVEYGGFQTYRERMTALHGDDESWRSGPSYASQRLEYEETIMGVTEERGDSDMPIYGWSMRQHTYSTLQYGDIDIRLKPEVKARTTWTVGDSLDRRVRPLWTAEIETADDIDLVASSPLFKDYVMSGGDLESGWAEEARSLEYVEAQVHGGITLDDIESVGLQPSAVLSDATRGVLVSRGIRIDSVQVGAGFAAHTLSFSFNPGQARAPRGSEIGGQWIDTPSGMLAEVINPKAPPAPQPGQAPRRTGKPPSPQLVDDLRDYFDQRLESRRYGDLGFTVSVATAVGRNGTVDLEGDITAPNGRLVGMFVRTFAAREGKNIVYHQALSIQPEYQNKGFATDFLEHSEKMYQELGVDEIHLSAGLSAGGYAWARAGFDWREVYGDHHIALRRDHVTHLIDSYAREGKTEDLQRLTDLFDAIEDQDMARVPSPAELSTWTDSDGNHVGKMLLMGSQWDGVKRLTPAVEAPALAASLSGGDFWYTSQMRSDMLYAFCRERGLDIDAEEWPAYDENAWLDIDRAGAAGRASLTAAGTVEFAFNPTQARAPKGSPVGGRWVNTPSGLVDRLTNLPVRQALALDRRRPSEILHGTRTGRVLTALPRETRTALAATTRLALLSARSAGVKVQVTEGALSRIMADGRVRTLFEASPRDARSFSYLENRQDYETFDMGVPTDRASGDRPIYGWGTRRDVRDTLQYGDIELVLSTRVKERTTWTVGDSLDNRALPLWSDELETLPDEALLAASSWAVRYDALSTGWENGPFRSAHPYVEAQVHGGVTLEDIREVRVTGPRPLRTGVDEALEDLGIQVTYQQSPEEAWDSWPGNPLPVEPPALVAAGGPGQARAPKGTPIGGQWIVTPGGLLKLVQLWGPEGRLNEAGEQVDEVLKRPAPTDDPFMGAWSTLSTEERYDLAMITQGALQEAVSTGVTISMFPDSLESIVDTGRFRTIHESEIQEDMLKGQVYLGARLKYEHDVMGLSKSVVPEHAPVYGWGSRYSPDSTIGYGNIDVTLRENVNARTTWTVGDSLNLQSRPMWSEEVMSNEPDIDALLAASHWAMEPTHPPRALPFESIEEGPLDGWVIPYIEAQVHGGITLSDIETVHINDFSEFDVRTLEALFDAGAEILDAYGNTYSPDQGI